MTKDEVQKLLDNEKERERERNRDWAEVQRLGQIIDKLSKDRLELELNLIHARECYTRADREYMDKWDGRKK